jgi:hypothetical protein
MEMSLEKYSGFNFHTEWERIDDKEKSIIGLALSDSELHHVDIDKSSKEIWEISTSYLGHKQ